MYSKGEIQIVCGYNGIYCFKGYLVGKNFTIIMNFVEGYAKSWTKREDLEFQTLYEWLKAVTTFVKIRLF